MDDTKQDLAADILYSWLRFRAVAEGVGKTPKLDPTLLGREGHRSGRNLGRIGCYEPHYLPARWGSGQHWLRHRAVADRVAETSELHPTPLLGQRRSLDL